jgi:hypothetical protein
VPRVLFGTACLSAHGYPAQDGRVFAIAERERAIVSADRQPWALSTALIVV